MRVAQRIPVAEIFGAGRSIDTIIDVRSPAEFAEDHLPGAVSAPVLDDRERAHVGQIWHRDSPFQARRIGAAIVSRNIARMLDNDFSARPPDWRPLVYCWRGGDRSGALAGILASVGWRTSVLEGGYKAFRRHVIDGLQTLPTGLHWHVIAGRTGSGKSLVLQALRARGEQIIDLEGLARHRGSVLGLPPGMRQPGQKAFETALWDALRRLDPASRVFVESESRRIGRCHLPDAMIEAIRNAPCTRLQAPMPLRVRLLLGEYRHFIDDPAQLDSRLDRLLELHGHVRIDAWKELAAQQRWPEFVESMLELHYDPAYERSMRTNFRHLEAGDTLLLEDDDAAIERVAAALAIQA